MFSGFPRERMVLRHVPRGIIQKDGTALDRQGGSPATGAMRVGRGGIKWHRSPAAARGCVRRAGRTCSQFPVAKPFFDNSTSDLVSNEASRAATRQLMGFPLAATARFGAPAVVCSAPAWHVAVEGCLQRESER